MALYETSDNSLNYLDLRARLYYYYAAYFSTTTYMLEYYIRFGWKGGYNQKYAAGKGILTAELDIPVKNKNTSSEIVDKRDIDAAYQIISKYLES